MICDPAIAVQSAVADVCLGKTGADHQYVHPIISQLGSERFKQTVQGVFAGRVPGSAQQRGKSRDGTDNNN